MDVEAKVPDFMLQVVGDNEFEIGTSRYTATRAGAWIHVNNSWTETKTSRAERRDLEGARDPVLAMRHDKWFESLKWLRLCCIRLNFVYSI